MPWLKPLPDPVRRPGADLEWHQIEVQGRRASYGVGGDGPPVLFLHGWALGNHAYKRAVRRLTDRGCRVYAPAMPGFSRSADLPRDTMSIEGYAGWVDQFMEAAGIDEPALVIGHSFGGGVAIKLANDFPDRVRYLVLLNSVGGGTGVHFGARPPWDWVMGFAREFLPLPKGVELLQAIRQDIVTNMLTNPLALVRAGDLARTADLTSELAELRSRKMPVLALTSDDDSVIPRVAFDALCTAVGTEGRFISGRHSWLLADPGAFGEVMRNLVEVQVAEHRHTTATTRAAQISELLELTSVPRRRARSLVREASPLWLMTESPVVLAGDLAMCHPTLKRNEVRAVARPIEGSFAVHLTVVAHDRPGLLADSAAVLAGHGLSVSEASAGTWGGLALHGFTLQPDGPIDDDTWADLGRDLEAMVGSPVSPHFAFMPLGLACAEADGEDIGRSLVRVTAKDQVGLLWAICRWFADHDISIEAVHASTEQGVASDTFVVQGKVDADALAAHLSSTANGNRSRNPLGGLHAWCPLAPVQEALAILQRNGRNLIKIENTCSCS
jgi:pimeloyl-ACP methyl ester carboxylesterase/predicted amino acid-binding ACT domain protein